MKHEGVKTGVSVNAVVLARGGRDLFPPLSFAAAPGDLIELRGANGAGKTSLLRALAGFLRPSAGRIAFDAPEPQERVHFVGHQNGLKGSASARAHLRYWAELLGGGAVESAIAAFGLERIADLPTRVLSQGQQRSAALARLVVAPRPLWLLDEPAASLDARARDRLVVAIDAHRADGGIAIVATHDALGAAPTQTITLAAEPMA